MKLSEIFKGAEEDIVKSLVLHKKQLDDFFDAPFTEEIKNLNEVKAAECDLRNHLSLDCSEGVSEKVLEMRDDTMYDHMELYYGNSWIHNVDDITTKNNKNDK